MPVYEFQCKRCGKISSFLERVGQRRWWGRRCSHCGSRRLQKVLSSFATARSPSMTEMLNEMKKMGEVRFVPQYPGMTGPPPGGCPYAREEDSSPSSD